VIRLSIALPPGQEITDYPAISPDGQTIAYAARQGTQEAQLYIRKLNSFESQVVIGSSGRGQRPFFRPDGKWVAFFADGYLKKVEVAGGSPIKIAVAPLPFGGSWGDDDTIVFVPTLNFGLFRVPAAGGNPESLTRPDGAGNGYAHVFPNGSLAVERYSFLFGARILLERRCFRWTPKRGKPLRPRAAEATTAAPRLPPAWVL
jgi:hypothetical protein